MAVNIFFRTYWSPYKEELYKDIWQYSNSKLKNIMIFFVYSIIVYSLKLIDDGWFTLSVIYTVYIKYFHSLCQTFFEVSCDSYNTNNIQYSNIMHHWSSKYLIIKTHLKYIYLEIQISLRTTALWIYAVLVGQVNKWTIYITRDI